MNERQTCLQYKYTTSNIYIGMSVCMYKFWKERGLGSWGGASGVFQWGQYWSDSEASIIKQSITKSFLNLYSLSHSYLKIYTKTHICLFGFTCNFWPSLVLSDFHCYVTFMFQWTFFYLLQYSLPFSHIHACTYKLWNQKIYIL